MNFSSTKNPRIAPAITHEMPTVIPPSSASSGRMWNSASPRSAPTAKLTRIGTTRWSSPSRTIRITIPTNAIRLTMRTETIVWTQTVEEAASTG